MDFTLKCNTFEQTTEIPTGQTRIGLLIGEDVALTGNKIGGSNPGGTDAPNSNFFPQTGTGWSDPIVTDYVCVKNMSITNLDYWRYHNEKITVDPVTGAGMVTPKELSDPTFVYNDNTLAAYCDLNSDCGVGTDCSTQLLLGATDCNNSSMIPVGAEWVPACTTAVDGVIWPLPKPASDTTLAGITMAQEQLYGSNPALDQGYPNPTNRSILIPYFIPWDSEVTEIQIMEIATGKLVSRHLVTGKGKHLLDVDVSNFASGLYSYHMLVTKGKNPRAQSFAVIH